MSLDQASFDSLEHEIRRLNAALRTANTENRDLRIHLRDRDAHIRNLEAELLSRDLLDGETPGEQEALL